MRAYDPLGDDPSFDVPRVPALQLQCGARSPEYKARLYLKMRLHMLMQLKGCTLEEALRHIEQFKH